MERSVKALFGLLSDMYDPLAAQDEVKTPLEFVGERRLRQSALRRRKVVMPKLHPPSQLFADSIYRFLPGEKSAPHQSHRMPFNCLWGDEYAL